MVGYIRCLSNQDKTDLKNLKHPHLSKAVWFLSDLRAVSQNFYANKTAGFVTFKIKPNKRFCGCLFVFLCQSLSSESNQQEAVLGGFLGIM